MYVEWKYWYVGVGVEDKCWYVDGRKREGSVCTASLDPTEIDRIYGIHVCRM